MKTSILLLFFLTITNLVWAQEEAVFCTMEYAPVCASTTIDGNQTNKTFSNRCMMDSDKQATFLYDGECKTSNNQTKPQGDISNSTYSSELNSAYQYAYSIGITTMPTIQQANLNGSLIRAHMAKMIVNYATNIVGLTPDTSKSCNFTDISDQSSELKSYIVQSCQLGLMGQGISLFRPDDTVTRAQFGTVLSRVLFGDIYDLPGYSTQPYYTDHLSALQEVGVIKNTNPALQETRGYVMLMLSRAR